METVMFEPSPPGHKVMYRGRNGMSKCEGLELLAMSDFVLLSPLNSRGTTSACFIEIPPERLGEFIEALQKMQKEYEK